MTYFTADTYDRVSCEEFYGDHSEMMEREEILFIEHVNALLWEAIHGELEA